MKRSVCDNRRVGRGRRGTGGRVVNCPPLKYVPVPLREAIAESFVPPRRSQSVAGG